VVVFLKVYLLLKAKMASTQVVGKQKLECIDVSFSDLVGKIWTGIVKIAEPRPWLPCRQLQFDLPNEIGVV
jgi:hypothetical protein